MTTLSAMSPWVGNILVNYFLRNTDYNPASGNIYVGLFTVTPSDTRTGTEVSGGGYARQEITFDISGGSAVSNAKVTFPEATTDWGRIIGVALFDSVTSGNMLFWGNMYNSLTVNDGEIYSINSGELYIELEGASSGGWGIDAAGSALNLILDNGGFGGTPPANVYMALGTSLTVDSVYGFSSWSEVSAGSYSRKAITWNAPSEGVTSNTSEIVFYASPIPEEWGRITHIVIYDNSSGGNTLMWGN